MYTIHNDTVITICLTTLALILTWEILDHIFSSGKSVQHIPRNEYQQKPPSKKKSIRSKKGQSQKLSVPDSANIIISGSTGDIVITPSLISTMAKVFPEESRSTLIRFLIARKASIKDSCDMLEKFRRWHAANMPPPPTLTEGALATKCMFAHGKALDDSPIVYFRGALYDSSAAPSMAYALAAAHLIEQLTAELEPDCTRTVGESVTVLIHTAFIPGGINAPADVGFIRDFVQVLSDNYPERLRRLIVYPFPWYGRAVWVVVKPFLDPRTADKVVLFPQGPDGETPCPPDIGEFVDIDQIPIICGGKSDAAIAYPSP